MPGSKSPLVRNIAHTFGTNVLLVPLGFMLSILLARFLGPTGKGAYDLFVATGTLLATIVGFSMGSGLVYVVAMAMVRLRAMISRMAGVVLLQALVALALLMLVHRIGILERFLPPGIGRDAIYLCALYVLLTQSALYWRSILIGLQDIVWSNRLVLLSRVVELTAAVAFVTGLLRFDMSRVRMLLLGMLASQLFANVILLVRIRHHEAARRTGGSGIQAVARYSAPTYLSNLSQFLVYRLDLFLVGYFVGQRGVGLYALAVSLAQLLWIPAQATSTALLPDVASQQDASGRNASVTARVTRVTLLLCGGAAVCLSIGALLFLPLVYGEQFRPAITPLVLLLPGTVILGAAFVTSSYIAAVGRPELNMWISLVTLTITGTLDVLLIPRIGINGAAIASTISYTVSALLTFWAFVRLTRVPMRTVVHERGELLRLASELPRLLFGRLRNAG
jgi:O-antigen/teichoic acid export membrane protein